MWAWAWFLLTATLPLVYLQQKAEPSEIFGTETPFLNIVNNDTTCFNVKSEACNVLEEGEPCLCKTLDHETVFCCHITNPYQLNNNLRCAGKERTNVKG